MARDLVNAGKAPNCAGIGGRKRAQAVETRLSHTPNKVIRMAKAPKNKKALQKKSAVKKKTSGFSRPSGRKVDQLRKVTLTPGASKYAEGSCLAKFGGTHVLCTASVEDRVPPFLRNTGKGWVTAEYGMLPRSTHTRSNREAARGKQSGRTQEIQRLIGRSLRAVIDLEALGERQIRIDCDVLQADGGTRTAAITGSFIALYQALQGLVKSGDLKSVPMTDQVAAISCGIYNGKAVLDLDYAEDSNAQADANFVLTAAGEIVEIQGTAEQRPFSEAQFNAMLKFAKAGVKDLAKAQLKALKISAGKISAGKIKKSR